jgi:GT2 family glycosyltransferase
VKVAETLAEFLGALEARLRFGRASEITVSIVILTYNRAEHTYRCLDSILLHADVPYELIIVDNVSHDETGHLLVRLDNATILRNAENVGFRRGLQSGCRCRAWALFLVPQQRRPADPGLLAHVARHGRAHSRLQGGGMQDRHADGRLQEAGPIVGDDGTTLEYGRHDQPDALQYSYVRVDYCSAACLLVRTDVWKRTGGFDARYAPAYYKPRKPPRTEQLRNASKRSSYPPGRRAREVMGL